MNLCGDGSAICGDDPVRSEDEMASIGGPATPEDVERASRRPPWKPRRLRKPQWKVRWS